MNRNSIRGAAAVAVALQLAAQLAAAEEEPTDIDQTGEPHEVVVTATRYPVLRDQVLPATIVIEREELQRSLAVDVADVLRFRTGLEFGRNGGPGQTTSLFMRGTDSNHTLVLVDGVRINPGTVGGAALQNLAPELIDRIEVVKGPRSTLYGTDAIGGVVQIFTRAGEAQGLSAEGGYGADSTIAANTTGGWSNDSSHVGFGVNYFETDGFPPRKDDPRGGAYDNLSFNVAGSTEVSGNGTLGLTYWRSAGAVDYIGFSSRTFDNALVTQDYTSDAAALSYAWTLGEWDSRIELGRMTDDLEQVAAEDDLGAFDPDVYARTDRNSIAWQNDFDLSEWNRFSVGASYYEETARAPEFGEIETDVANGYLQDRITLGRHTLVLAGGYVDHESFGGHATWNAEYGIDVGAATRLVAAAGTAFRAPDATDRYGFAGNPELEPEESQNYELGLRQRFGSSQRVSLSAFQNEIDELVTYDFAANLLRNVDRARIRGIEASYEYTGDTWRLRTEAIYQEPEDRTTGEPLLRRAKENFTLAVGRRFGPVDLGLDVLAAGERQDFGAELDSYMLANLTARFDFGTAWSVQARVENLLDEDYELARGYNVEDRSVFVALRYSPR
jgi:vitamin B12 transporter